MGDTGAIVERRHSITPHPWRTQLSLNWFFFFWEGLNIGYHEKSSVECIKVSNCHHPLSVKVPGRCLQKSALTMRTACCQNGASRIQKGSRFDSQCSHSCHKHSSHTTPIFPSPPHSSTSLVDSSCQGNVHLRWVAETDAAGVCAVSIGVLIV